MAKKPLLPDSGPTFEADELPSVAKALLFYRVMAWIVGILLAVLVLVGMPLKYLGGDNSVVILTGVPHGWLYMLLLISAYNLGRRVQWPWQRLLVIALAGTVPFLSFVAERFATKDVHQRMAHVEQKANAR